MLYFCSADFGNLKNIKTRNIIKKTGLNALFFISSRFFTVIETFWANSNGLILCISNFKLNLFDIAEIIIHKLEYHEYIGRYTTELFYLSLNPQKSSF